MGSAQSQEQPDVVRIDRSEIPEEYKTVGVSSDVVRRVNAQNQGDGSDADRLRNELAREREEKARLREEMMKLSELQQRKVVNGQSSTMSDLTDDIEERKRIFDETVERVQQKFFAYHRENVCADHEKDTYEMVLRVHCGLCNRAFVFSSSFAAEKRYANCSLSTCLRTQNCMLDYGFLSVYIQPLLTVVDENGDVITPLPSKEFHIIRSMLKLYSVLDPKDACIVLPGVDFLNLHRFPSIEMAHFIAGMISERFYNVLIFTLIGQWRHTFRQIMAGTMTSRHLYRHHLDISLPPFPGFVSSGINNTVTRNNLLVLMMNASTSFKEECMEIFGDSKDVTIITECNTHPWFTCDLSGNRIDWRTALRESKFVLVHERMPLFKRALYKALESSVVPVIFTPNYVLPFSDYIDWHLISLHPASLSRVLDVISSLEDSKVQAIRSQMQAVFENFSSLEGIVNITLRVLEARMLPLKTLTYEQWNKQPEQMFTLPHFEPATPLSLLAHSDSKTAKYTVQLVRQLVSEGLISSATIIWRDEEISPFREMWETSVPVEIITGVKRHRDLFSIVKRNNLHVLLVVPLGECRLEPKIVRKALNIWRTVPDRLITIPCLTSDQSVTVIYKMFFTASLLGDREISTLDSPLDFAFGNASYSLHMITRDQLDGKTSAISLFANL
ncbi:exostosin family protein [Necator americanus]|uniref:Exostosin family protein n=1 Tax=Necator americanus TaxID=51031 RepID=W2SNC1_NECAM|nr:exostosin family protein [Necator americanus]ETN71033.1 exostosin family protein [Necator americanus]